jgi:hypothetical protein
VKKSFLFGVLDGDGVYRREKEREKGKKKGGNKYLDIESGCG